MFDKNARTEILMISEVQQPLFVKHYGTQAERFHLLPPGIQDCRAPANAAEIRAEFRREFNSKTMNCCCTDRFRFQDQGEGSQPSLPSPPAPGPCASAPG